MSDCETCKYHNEDDKNYKCRICYWGDMYKSKYEITSLCELEEILK